MHIKIKNLRQQPVRGVWDWVFGKGGVGGGGQHG
jgi:hypothetical protein